MAIPSKVSDKAFGFEDDRLDKLSLEKPWFKEPAYFNKCQVTASAAMKMMQHAQAGVEAGLARQDNPVPIEIIGFMFGHVDPDNTKSIVVTDAFPLPVEGSETAVVADKDEVTEFMPKLTSMVGSTRKDRLIGWYHSHPFEVGELSNCYFSGVDVQNQNVWQISQEAWSSKGTDFESKARGDPFVGIVLDPLRSVAKQRPEMACFRNYPTDYRPPARLGPDGQVFASDDLLQARWGPVAQSYYMLPIELVMSSTSKRVIDGLARDFVWTRVLASTPHRDKETRDALQKRLATAAGQAERAAALPFGHDLEKEVARAATGSSGAGSMRQDAVVGLPGATKALADASSELQRAQMTQLVKQAVFAGAAVEGKEEAAEEKGKAGRGPASGSGAS